MSTDSTSSITGSGTTADPYVIKDLAGLKEFRDNVNNGVSYSGKYVKLAANIDLGGEEWTPIGTAANNFQGTFDGGDYTISNLVISGYNSNVGFFGYTTNGEVKNLTIHNAKVSGRLSVGVVAGTPSVGIVAEAIGTLSDEAANPVLVMNKGSWAQFKAAAYSAGYSIDPFEGLPVHFENTLPAYTAGGTTGSTWLIVGDFGQGAQANFPNGDDITIKFDDLSLAESDLVKIVGRQYVGLGVVADHAFCKVTF